METKTMLIILAVNIPVIIAGAQYFGRPSISFDKDATDA
jgi:hypothetical protein